LLQKPNIKVVFLAIWGVAVLGILLAIYNIDNFTKIVQASVASVEELQGALLARSEGVVRWRDLIKGQGVFDGDTLATAETSGAKIRFDKFRALVLGEDSQVQITAIGSQRGSAYIIRLIRGSAVPQVADKCKECPPLILRAGEESYTISAGKKIAVFKPQGSRQARAVQAKIIPTNADLRSVVSAIKPTIVAIAPPPLASVPEPILAPVFLVPLPPAPPVPAPPPPATGSTKVGARAEAPTEGRVDFEPATGDGLSSAENAEMQLSDPLDALVLDKMPAPMMPPPMPSAPQLQNARMGLTELSSLGADAMKIDGANLGGLAPNHGASELAGFIGKPIEEKKVTSTVNLNKQQLAAKKIGESKSANQQMTPSNSSPLTSLKVVPPKPQVVAVIPPSPPPPAPLPPIKVESPPPPRGVEYWTMRNLENPQGGALDLPVPALTQDKPDGSVTLRAFISVSGNGQTEEIFVAHPNDATISVPLKTIKKVGVTELFGGIKRYHFKIRAGVEASRGINQRTKSLADGETKLTVVTLGEIPDGPINIGVSDFAPKPESADAVWIAPKKEVELFQSGLVIQLMSSADFGRFSNLIRDSNLLALDKRHPLSNEGYFVVREDLIVAQISGTLLNKQIISKTSSLLNGDFVFKGQRQAFQNIREFAQNRPGDPMWSLLNKGHVLYILKKGTLYPVSREFLKSSTEVAAFIGNQAQAVFVGKVEIVSHK